MSNQMRTESRPAREHDTSGPGGNFGVSSRTVGIRDVTAVSSGPAPTMTRPRVLNDESRPVGGSRERYRQRYLIAS
jgi:hypothetical protein